MMRDLITILVMFLCIDLTGQTTIVDGGVSNIDLPMDCYYRYSYTEMIYLQSEINESGDITEIQLEWNGNSGWTEPIKIWIGHTTKTVFDNNTDWVTSANMTLVYDGDITVTTTDGWVSITLDNSFTYNNIDNLVIGIDENGYDYHSTSDNFYTKSTPSNYRSIYYSNDNTNPNPASPPEGGTFYYVPSLKLGIVSMLPIKLVSFDVEYNDKFIFNWVTASEINVDRYEIEYSEDGKIWLNLGEVKANGNSSTELNYIYTSDITFDAAFVYFRLRNIDYDGYTETFDIVSFSLSLGPTYKKIVGIYDINGIKLGKIIPNQMMIIHYNDGTSEKLIEFSK